MRTIKWLALAAGAILILSCFFPWVLIESKNIIVSGVSSEGTSFGKPGYLHIFFTILFFIFLSFNRVWGYRTNLIIAAFNMGWALRNFILIPACEGGECPQKQLALYITVLSSLVLLITSFFGGALKPAKKDIHDINPVP
jgi:hypothetical protein